MKKKITLSVIAVLLVISLVVGISYAYWKTTYQATNINKIVSSCFSMEITNEKNNIILDDAYPITDDKGKALTPYSFTITNTCDLFASYTINLEMLEGTTLNSKYIKTMVNNEAITNLSTLDQTDPSIEGAVESRILFRGSLGSGDSIDYTFRVWMDYDTPNNEESMNKSFQGKITVTAEVSTYSPVENGFTNLAEALLVNEYQTTSLDVAKNKIASKQEVDFSETAPDILWDESKENSTSVFGITRATSDLIGSYGITEKHVNILLGTDYTFDSETGYYKLKNRQYVDLDNLDFVNNKYYSCGSTVSVGGDDIIKNTDGLNCVNMREVIGYNSVEESYLKLSTGDTIPTKKYIFESITHTSVERENDKSDKGLYKAQDDYGVTYYYRGNVKNNNIKFAGFNWQIIRVNGDRSVRLIYNGSDTSTNTHIGRTTYNAIKTDPTYVGYMFSNTLNSSYEDTIKNDNDGTLKIGLDKWYKNNIYDKGYSSYIADSGFCNDRSFAQDNQGNGFNDETLYAARYRVSQDSPILTCPNKDNDLFTMPSNTIGNKALTYPVGLITVDEIIFAGFTSNSINIFNYLNTDYVYWTMTPYAFSSSLEAKAYLIDGKTGIFNNRNVTGSEYVRPVINLKADTEITGGIGTKNDPFIVK